MAAEQQRPPVAPYIFYHAFRPQIAIYSSPDVDELAAANGLGNLAQLLKPWEASVERVTLRTSTFASHVVPVFPLLIDDVRDLVHTELDALFLDNLSGSITKRVPEWLAPMDSIDVHDDIDQDLWKEGTVDELTPWYGYYREKLVNLRPRTEYETFGHPVACMLAVSTANPEPLNAFAELYEATSPDKLFADKPWVDPNVLRYYVLVHDATVGPAEDFVPLLEDVRRAYGLHTNMLILNAEAAPKPDSAYIDASQRPQPKPADFSNHWTDLPTSPTLPQFASGSAAFGMSSLQTPGSTPEDTEKPAVEPGAMLGQEDVRRIKLFLREFVVQNLAPWLEKTTTQLSEQLAANRKGIAGRLFSAGRRYFGSRPASPAVGNAGATSAFDSNKGFYRHATQEAQTRKLADFALMIADYRLAAANYELARKDFLNDKAWRYYTSATRMAGLLNLLLRKGSSNTVAVTENDQYLEQASNSPIAGSAQLDGLRTIALYYELYQEQEDWRSAASALARFASDTDELPSALMIEQAAMVMLRLSRPARRRFALLMTIAAHRYQKTGPKSLADRCGRQALTLFSNLDCRDWISFRNHLEHMLGRQAYNDGKPEIALRHFLRILVEHCEGDDASADQDFLDDLELAWSRLGDTADQMSVSEGFTLPRTVFDPSRTAIRVKALNPAAIRSDMEAWTSLEQTFLDKGFPYVPEGAQNPIKRPSSLLDDASINIAITGETFEVDLWARNDLAVPVILSDISIVFDGSGRDCLPQDLISEVVKEHTLAPSITTKLSVTVQATKEGTFTVKGVSFRYNRNLASTESLSRRGDRLYATKAQLLEPTYAEDSSLKIAVKPPQPILQVVGEDAVLELYAGETRNLALTLINAGSQSLRDLRVLCDAHHIAVDATGDIKPCAGGTIAVDNSLRIPRPSAIALPHQSLAPGQSIQWNINIRSEELGQLKLRWLFAFRSETGEEQNYTKLYTGCYSHELVVQPSLAMDLSVAASSFDGTVLSLDVDNCIASTAIEISGLTVLSHSWQLNSPQNPILALLDSNQAGHFEYSLERVADTEDPHELLSPTLHQLSALLQGRDLDSDVPSRIKMAFSSSGNIDTTCTPERLRTVLTDLRQKSLQRQVPSLGQDTLARIFPLHLPWSLSVIIFWRLPDLNRQGWNCINGDDAYSAVNVSRGLLQKASATLGGGRYEESAQERARLLQQLKLSDLGRSVCPVVVSQHVSDPQAKEVVSTRSAACLFRISNRGLEKVSCTLDLLSDNAMAHSVRWIGRLAFRCNLGAGETVSWEGRYVKPRAAQDQGKWLLTVTDGAETWRVPGTESLVGT